MTTRPDPIDAYLDELLGRLRGEPGTVRRILVETEAHLRDAVDAGAAPDAAIAAFGSPAVVAAHHGPSRRPWPSVVHQLVVTGCLLAAVGLVAVGVSGVVAVAMDATLGPRFVAGDLPTTVYSAARCAELHEYAGVGRSCLAAAARHHTDEVETYRIGAGVLGALGLAAWWWWRRTRRRGTDAGLPRLVVDAVAATAFGAGAVLAAAQATAGLDARTTAGLGQWLSGAVVAAAFTAVFAVRVALDLRDPTAS